jgi:hypothetical protein
MISARLGGRRRWGKCGRCRLVGVAVDIKCVLVRSFRVASFPNFGFGCFYVAIICA